MISAFFNAHLSQSNNEDDHEKTLRENWEDCKDFDYHSLQHIAENIDERRVDYDNHFFQEYHKIAKWFQTKNNNRMIEATRGPTAMSIVYILLAGFLLILFILALFNVVKRDGSKSCLYVAIVCWIIYSCFFWASFTL